jgi:pimeloyl-ACP methyl ester carboxylesterase
MTAATNRASELTVQVGETELHLLKGGSGPPLLVLHGIEGPEGWLAFHEALAESATVYAPDHPGYGQTRRPDWLESISHQALFYLWFLQEQGLDKIDLLGCGIGGWIAAEMATMSPQSLRHLVLVDPAGIRPREGELLDVFVIPWRQVIERAVADPSSAEYQRVYGANPIIDFGGHREPGRQMSMRMCYRPYMYSTALEPLLARVRVPSLIVWGADDQLIPPECADIWRSAIPGARSRIMEDCGHLPHFDKPQELARVAREFLAE